MSNKEKLRELIERIEGMKKSTDKRNATYYANLSYNKVVDEVISKLIEILE